MTNERVLFPVGFRNVVIMAKCRHGLIESAVDLDNSYRGYSLLC